MSEQQQQQNVEICESITAGRFGKIHIWDKMWVSHSRLKKCSDPLHIFQYLNRHNGCPVLFLSHSLTRIYSGCFIHIWWNLRAIELKYAHEFGTYTVFRLDFFSKFSFHAKYFYPYSCPRVLKCKTIMIPRDNILFANAHSFTTSLTFALS